jgi:hypothetical protein
VALRAVTGFKSMNSFYLYAFAMLAAWTGLASADETNVAVFGLPLGAQLQISECAKKDLGGLTIYPPAAATCFERLGTQERVRATAPVENDSILIRFAAAEAPAVMSGGTGIGLVVNGRLEGLTFNTRGVDAQAQAMDALKQTFGEPTSIAPKLVENSLGQSFDSFDAVWKSPQVEILYRGVTSRVDVGLLSVASALGRDHRQQRTAGPAKPAP